MIYVCGDSFAASDKQSTITPWHEQLECVNLSQVCATNLQISQQVDHAIEHASFIIVLFTTCVRFEFGDDSYTLHNLTTSNLSKVQQHLVTEHAKNFFDLDLEIYRNKCIIESVLQRLVDSDIPFLFDQVDLNTQSLAQPKSILKHGISIVANIIYGIMEIANCIDLISI